MISSQNKIKFCQNNMIILNIVGCLLLIVLGFLCYIGISFIGKTYYRLRFYKKQGIDCFFFPGLGYEKRDRENEEKQKDILFYYKTLSKTNPDIPCVASNFADDIELLLFDPKLIKDFYSKQSLYKKALLADPIRILMGTGLFLAEGETWKNHRKSISTIFHFEFLRKNIPLIQKTAKHSLLKLSQQKDLKKVDVMNEMHQITGEIVGKIFFSDNLNQEKIEEKPITICLAELMSRISLQFKNPFILFSMIFGISPAWVPSYRKFMQDVYAFRRKCHQIIQNRKKSGVKSSDLLDLLLEKQKAEDPDDQFTDDDIVNEFITFFGAGMDTTGHLITMTLYLLQKNQESLDKIEKEIEEIYNDDELPDTINKMNVLHGAVKEGLRFYNPAPTIVPRVAQVDHQIEEINISKGTNVRAQPMFNYFNEKYFSNPEQFSPERWTSENKITNPFVDLPFSSGARNCIGQHLAMIEAKIILIEFIKLFTFKVVPENHQPVMTFTSMYEPKEKIFMDLVVKK